MADDDARQVAKETVPPVEEVTKMTGGAELVDMPAALERVGGDRELLAEIAGLFLGEYSQILADIRRAIDAGDFQQLERAAHNLKGSVANFGATAAVAAAFALERLGREGELNEARAALARVEEEMQALRPALEQLASGMQPS